VVFGGYADVDLIDRRETAALSFPFGARQLFLVICVWRGKKEWGWEMGKVHGLEGRLLMVRRVSPPQL
jgi:hypothetical protein